MGVQLPGPSLLLLDLSAVSVQPTFPRHLSRLGQVTRKRLTVMGAGRTGQGPTRRKADLRLHARFLTRCNLPKYESNLGGKFTRVKCETT
jgi:hypothetical protein